MLLERLSPDDMQEVSMIFESAGKLGFNILKKAYELSKTGTDNGVRQQLIQYSQENPFVFRGSNQDLSWFWSRSELPIDKLNQLQEPLKDHVLRNFGALQQQGLVNYDGRVLTLTAEGNRVIHDAGYISEVIKADQELNQQIQNVLGKAAETQRFHPASAAQAAGQASTQIAGKAASAVTTAGVAMAAQAAQEVITMANKAINQSITHTK